MMTFGLFLLLLFHLDLTGACSRLDSIYTVSAGQTCTISSSLTIAAVQVYGTLIINGNPSEGTVPGIYTPSLYVGPDGLITADGKGYSSESGPGAGTSMGSGGSYGGRGGIYSGSHLWRNESLPYGNSKAPQEYGSGGGGSCGGNGGGVILLDIAHTIYVDGKVSANGNDGGSGCGGGSGGSIFIKTLVLAGEGLLHSRGGDGLGNGGAGSGGRISIVYRGENRFTGQTLADGGLINGMLNVLVLTMAATSYSSYPAYYGRIGYHSSRSWRSRYQSTSTYLEATFTESFVTKIASKGDPSSGYYVKSYKVNFYNASSSAWESLPYFSNALFTGNTNSGSEVTHDLYSPILTTQLRFYPQSWHSRIGMAVKVYGYTGSYKYKAEKDIPPKICASTSSAGAGGPGTIYISSTDTSGVLIIDSKGKDPKIAKNIQCNEFDVETSGAAAWFFDAGQLDNIILSYGSHLVLSNNVKVSKCEADDNSVLHLLSNNTLQLANTLMTNAFIHPNATFVTDDGDDLYIEKWLYILGNISFSAKEEIIINGNLTVEVQEINAGLLKISEEAEMHVVGNYIFPLNVTKFSIFGKFVSGIINITGIEVFTVGEDGLVEMDPVETDMNIGHTFDNSGEVYLQRAISMVNPCYRFAIDGGGKLVWPGLANITMECNEIYINGLFKPGTINFGDGALILKIGKLADFEFTANGTILTNSFWASGTTKIKNIAEFKSLNETDGRIALFYLDKGGKLYLNTESKPKLIDGIEVNTTYSNIRSKYMIINGYLDAKTLSIDPGVKLLSVGLEGTLMFTSYHNFLAHEIEIFGQMDVFNPIVFRGQMIEKVETLTIGENGLLTLDFNAQSSKAWTGVSEIPLHYAYINGELKAGRMINHMMNETDEGWNYMYLHNGSSTFEFETDDPFLLDTADINGTFKSYKPIAIRAFTPGNPLTIFVGWVGHVQFDSERSHPIGPFSSNSSIIGVKFTTDTSSLFQAANTHFVLDNLEIGGTMYAQPESTVEIKKFVITSSGAVNITTPINLRGETLDNSGTLDIDYRRWPENTDEGNEKTNIYMEKEVIISGTLKAGSLYIETPKVTVTGNLDVNGGGYLTNTGPGAGVSHTSGASGGSYGGRGGKGRYASAQMPYGSIFGVGTWGSGGGSSSSYRGGRGGGRLHVETTSFTLSGNIYSNGDNSVGHHAGGGSGGSIYINCNNLDMTGYMYSKGGSGTSNGAGGSGGRVNVVFHTGRYESGHVITNGGSGREPGGSGIMYFHGDKSRGLRVDNKCQKPTVTEPTGTSADMSNFNTYKQTGGISFLLPTSNDFVYDFTIIEIYGGAHLTMNGIRIRVKSIKVVGDDTGHFHIPPDHTLELIEDSEYGRANVTYHPFIYEKSTWIWPDTTLEFRESLDERGKGISSSACTSSYLNSNTVKIWGTVIGDLTDLLVATGATLTFELSATRQLKFANITIQNGGILDLQSNYGNESDMWQLEVKREGHTGMLNVEGGGQFLVRNLQLNTNILKIDSSGTMSASGQGLTAGSGAGATKGGGGYGGRGGAYSASGYLPGKEYGSLYGPCLFGSGGYSATTSSGAGGGMININVTHTVIVEGLLKSDGLAGSTSRGGGSGGCILIDTHTIEGKGIIQVNGGNGASTTGAGGGGRMMIYYKDTQFWEGKSTAYGGITSSSPGGAGTVFLQDTIPDITNKTLIIDNNNQNVISSTISAYTASGYNADPGRTWISDSSIQQFESLRILGKANLALHPDLKDPFQLESLKFEGDHTGVLHVGNGQTIVVQHPDDLQFLINIYIYEGGLLMLPTSFECYNVNFIIWGRLGVVDMTVGDGCKLKLGSTGDTISTTVGTGVYDFNSLVVKAGGEVTVTDDLTNMNDKITITAGKLWVQGEGHVHAVQVNITAETLIVDDLGKIVGDLHDITCSKGNGFNANNGASGGGHGGRGGRGSGQMKTGAPYGQVFDAVDRGCKGGDTNVAGTGGRGGGVIFLKVTDTFQNDGEVTCNGENGRSSHAGGGSGGSINLDIHNIKGFGKFQSIGGDGSGNGGAGSGGRISMDFTSNKTFTGEFDTYGGLGKNNGSPGTSFFYHTVHDHTTLLLNNLNRGPNGDTNTIEDYFNLENDQLKAWFLPEHGRHTFAGTTSSYKFNELQIYGKAQLAVLTDPVESSATIYFHNMIGDRSGAIHVGKNQVMDLERPTIDLPFSVHVYDGGYLGLAPDTFIHGVDIFLNGTLANVDNLTLHHEGKLWLNIDGRTEGLAASTYDFQFVHVKNAGYLHMISDPVTEPSISFSTISLNIDGGGLVRGTYVYFFSENITIDSGGVLTASGLGYELADGDRTDSTGNVRKGLHGVINPGLGYTSSLGASGAGHGGSGGRGHCMYIL